MYLAYTKNYLAISYQVWSLKQSATHRSNPHSKPYPKGSFRVEIPSKILYLFIYLVCQSVTRTYLSNGIGVYDLPHPIYLLLVGICCIWNMEMTDEAASINISHNNWFHVLCLAAGCCSCSLQLYTQSNCPYLILMQIQIYEFDLRQRVDVFFETPKIYSPTNQIIRVVPVSVM
jgi:hypothetical protein